MDTLLNHVNNTHTHQQPHEMAEKNQDGCFDDSEELIQLQNDLTRLKSQLRKLNESELAHQEELEKFRSDYLKLKKYHGELKASMKTSRSAQQIKESLQVMQRMRPVTPHFLLRIVLGGQLNYHLASSAQKLAYKQDYEQFKRIVTAGYLMFSILGLLLIKNSIVFDGFVSFWGAAAYWIMIGREAVLKMNGSNIRGWWFAHHFLSMTMSALMIIWDKTQAEGIYHQLRTSLFAFYTYMGIVQILQYRYQMSRLYALRSLSRIDPMETTNELAQNVINYNLFFLLPFLVAVYLWQFYLAFKILFLVSHHSNTIVAKAVGGLYLVLALGNTMTTCYTYYRKALGNHQSSRLRSPADGTGDFPSASISPRKSSSSNHLLIREFSKSTEDLRVPK